LRSSTHIKAYTLMEMIVVMIISAIIVSMAYVVFTKVNVLAITLKKLYQANYQVVLLDKLVYADIEHADRVVKTADGFVCEFKNEKHTYHISDVIVRTQQHQIDTFAFIKDINMVFTFLSERETVIKTVKIEGVYEEEELNLFYAKEYGADVYVNDYE